MPNRNAALHLAFVFALPLAAQTDSAKLASVQGTVINSVTGAPVPRAQVLLNDRYAATTSIDGKFSIDGISRGAWALAAKHVGFAGSPQPTRLTLEPGDSKTGIEIKLTPPEPSLDGSRMREANRWKGRVLKLKATAESGKPAPPTNRAASVWEVWRRAGIA